MKKSTLFALLLFPFSCLSQFNSSNINVRDEIVIPKHYVVTKCTQQLDIDGQANEEAWKAAKFTDSFIDIEGIKIPKYETKLKMLWDEQYLYVYAYMEEEHIWASLKQRDTIIFYNNDFEVFIDPSGDTKNYGEIEINALGTVWDLFLDKPYRVGGKANNHWNINELKQAIHIKGTLNNPNDTDKYWSVEIAIPMQALIELKSHSKKLPAENEQWRINFSRVQWEHDLIDGKYSRKKENGKFLREYNWVFSNQNIINMHEPEKWAYLQFTQNPSSNNIEFIEDKDLLIKQTAYALFRKTRFGSLKYLNKEQVHSTKDFSVRYSDKKSLDVSFTKTNFGFEYKLVSPITNITYFINEEGVLKTQ